MLSAMFNSSGPRVGQIAADDAVRRVGAGEILLIDVRDPGEVQASGIAKGAIHIPLATFRMQADPSSPECHPDLKCDKPVAVYCASGGRSQMAAQAMLQMGFKEVYNLGGLMHWMQGGGELA